MSKYTIVVTTTEDRRLHFRTSNSKFVLCMHECGTGPLNVKSVKNLTLDELMIVEAYLDNPKSCEIIDNLTKKTFPFPL